MGTLPDCEPDSIKVSGDSTAKMIALTVFFLFAQIPTIEFHVSLIKTSVRN